MNKLKMLMSEQLKQTMVGKGKHVAIIIASKVKLARERKELQAIQNREQFFILTTFSIFESSGFI